MEGEGRRRSEARQRRAPVTEGNSFIDELGGYCLETRGARSSQRDSSPASILIVQKNMMKHLSKKLTGSIPEVVLDCAPSRKDAC